MAFAPVALVGAGANAAHTNIVLGRRGGPVETAWATVLATPSAGHVPFVAVLRPSIPAQPPTLFVAKGATAGELHERAIWVNPAVDDLDEAFTNQRTAAARAIEAAVGGGPTIDEVLAAARAGATNPFYTPGGAG